MRFTLNNHLYIRSNVTSGIAGGLVFRFTQYAPDTTLADMIGTRASMPKVFIVKWVDSFKRTWFSPCDKDGKSSWLQCATAKDALNYAISN